jgi:hypothetical protein
MAAKAILNWQLMRHFFVEGFDFGGTLYALEITADVPILEAKVLHAKAVERDAGIPSFAGKVECYSPESATLPADAKVGTKVRIYAPASTGQAGGRVIFGTAVDGSYARAGTVGEYQKSTLTFGFDGHAYLGKVLRNSVMDANMVANPDTTGASSAWQVLGVTASGQSMVSAVFLKTFVGTNAIFTINSDETAHGSVTSRAVHTLTAAGASLITVAGLISPDTDYQVVVSGPFTSASALVVVAIK